MSRPSSSIRALPSRPTKYRNRPCVLDGHRFASRREAARYAELALLQRAGCISKLILQPRFPLRINDVLVCTYVADFSYADANGRRVVEDVKSPASRTAVYKLKCKLLKALAGVAVVEVGV